MTRRSSLAATPLLAGLVAALSQAGCVVYSDRPNLTPTIGYADAGCVWDSRQGTYILYFDVDASDPDGVKDVIDVSADVYDDGVGGTYLATYGLFPEIEPVWYSAWIFETTGLDPGYGLYSADIVATDGAGAQTVVTVPLWPCF